MDKTSIAAAFDHVNGRPVCREDAVHRNLMLGPERCTLVTGQAGSGKTVLLAQWFDDLRDAGGSPSWCTAMPRGSIRTGSADITTSSGAPCSGLITPHTLQEMLECAVDQVLIIDEADHLDSAVIDRLVDHLASSDRPAPSQLVLASRARIEPLLDWSTTISIRTIGTTELALSDDATEQILLSYQPDITAKQLDKLVRVLRGWAAGTHLAGRAIAEAARQGAGVDMFDGQDIHLADYFETEIFAGLHPSDQDFLVTSSVLPALTIDSCSMLTGESLTEDRLHRLNRLNTFIEAELADGVWAWRPFAREYLAAKLRLRPPAEVLELRRRVRGWSTAKHRYDDAIVQASETEDWDAIIRLVLDVGMATAAAGDGETVTRWIRLLPSSAVRSEGGVAVIAAAALWLTHGDDARHEIDDWLGHAEAIRSGRPPVWAPSLESSIAVARMAFGRAQPGWRVRLDEVELPVDHGQDPAWIAFLCWATGLAAYMDDDSKSARRVLADCLQQHTREKDDDSSWIKPLQGRSALGLLALLDIEAGEPGRADLLLSTASIYAHESDQSSVRSDAILLAESRRAMQNGDTEAALAGLNRVGSHAKLYELRVLALLDTAAHYAETAMPVEHEISLAAADRILQSLPSPPALLTRLRREVEARPAQLDSSQPGDENALTERELEVLRLLDSELSRRQIAAQLFLAHNTVKTYIQRLYQKLDVSSRPAAVAKAREFGWLP